MESWAGHNGNQVWYPLDLPNTQTVMMDTHSLFFHILTISKMQEILGAY